VPGGRQQELVHLLLLADVVVLQLQVVVLFPEDLLVLRDGAQGLPVLAVYHLLRDFPCQAAGHADQPLAVRLKHFAVHARLVVVALQMRDADKLQQVPVPGLVLRVQHQVVVMPRTPGLAIRAVALGHIHLAADDGLHAGLFCRLVELNGSVHYTVVGKGDGGHVQVGGPFHHLLHAAGAVQQAVLGVVVQMYELRVCHRGQSIS